MLLETGRRYLEGTYKLSSLHCHTHKVGGDKYARMSTNLSYKGNFRAIKISRFFASNTAFCCKSYREQIKAKSCFKLFAKFIVSYMISYSVHGSSILYTPINPRVGSIFSRFSRIGICSASVFGVLQCHSINGV